MRRAYRAARQAVRRAAVLAPLIAAALGGVCPASAVSSARLNINIDILNIKPVFDLTATPGVSSGTINLAWTEPTRSAGVGPYSYDIRISSLAQISNDAQFLAAAPLSDLSPDVPPVPGAGGGGAAFVVTGLTENVLYYFAIREKDSTTVNGVWTRNPAQGWNVNNFAIATSTGPQAPTGLSATAGVLVVGLNWNPQPPLASGSGLLDYRVSRSLNAVSGFVSVTTTTATSYVDRPLTAGVTYYYKISARDVGAMEGPFSATVNAVPFTILPMEPLGVTVSATATDATLSWSPVTRFADGTPFFSTTTPTADELAGYTIFRSTDSCGPMLPFVHVSSLPTVTTTLVNATGGLNYFYHVQSYNTLGVSTSVLTISSLGERRFRLDQCDTFLAMDSVNAAALNAATNGRGADIRLMKTRRPEDTGGSVYQSAEWRAFLDGVTELRGFALPKPARIVMHYDTLGGVVVPSSAPVSGLSVAGNGAAPAAASPNNIGVYWYNGGDFKKMYGHVDTNSQTVTVESPNLGLYQVRALFRSDGAVFDVSNISGRVITPNNDGLNDVVIFTYDPGPRNAAVSGRIYDMTGALVADMVPGLVPNTLTWNGKMNGRAVTSGAYVYKIEGDGKTFTGTVVVAR